MPDEDSAVDPPLEAHEPAPLLKLREPLPEVIESPAGLEAAVAAVADGTGPIALDAERASGYRYSSRAYLVQLRREGTGTALIDPLPFDDLTALDAAIGDTEWVLHAAIQDLPCLTQLGMRPRSLFDTELAGRLLNMPRVGLATLVSDLLGWSMAKAHSAVDWSTRPLPEPWLEYAALDVEMLLELRGEMAERLEAAGKLGWAREEFEALLDFRGPAPRAEPWRRTSGIHRVRGRRALAVVRSLWEARNSIAQERDVAPGRILPDAVIIEVARSNPADGRALRSMPALRARRIRRDIATWVGAVDTALSLADRDLPSATARSNGPPPARAWADRDPAAADRLTACRAIVIELSKQHEVPPENLIAPDLIRRLAWEPPANPEPQTIGAILTDGGARRWQVDLIAVPLAEALVASGS